MELTAASGARPGDVSQRVFGEEGGAIGRGANNSWVLSHNKVSGHHAQITFRNGVFYIEDRSRNGVCVNSPENRLVKGRPYALKTGDRIFIEPYEIGVWIQGEPSHAAAPAADPFADLDPFAPSPDAPLSGSGGHTPNSLIVYPLELFPGPASSPRRSAPPPPPADDLLGQHYQPPPVLSPPAPPRPVEPAPAIPADYNPLDEAFPDPIAPPARPQPVRPQPPVPPPPAAPVAPA
jgi:type VI secretion system FHA domain protein